ncbi:hypothetical protein HG531_011285 [Fusarium graminearum]|nr:hypothetical protein HG531_011285 [Fusarium graminearum]
MEAKQIKKNLYRVIVHPFAACSLFPLSLYKALVSSFNTWMIDTTYAPTAPPPKDTLAMIAIKTCSFWLKGPGLRENSQENIRNFFVGRIFASSIPKGIDNSCTMQRRIVCVFDNSSNFWVDGIVQHQIPLSLELGIYVMSQFFVLLFTISIFEVASRSLEDVVGEVLVMFVLFEELGESIHKALFGHVVVGAEGYLMHENGIPIFDRDLDLFSGWRTHREV